MEGRERMQISTIEAVVEQSLLESLTRSGLTRSDIRERILDQAHIAGREKLISPLRRVDLKFSPPTDGLRRYLMDVYGTQPECVRGISFSAW